MSLAGAAPALERLLGEARDLGFLGPSDLAPQIEHARGFGRILATEIPTEGSIADLGAGGGLPSLVLLVDHPTWHLVLIETMVKRAEFLRRAVRTLDVADRARVVEARAEVAGRDPELRGAMDAVVARSFGPPATTAECGAPLLRPGGVLVVSEPPETEDRWPVEGLAYFGLEPAGSASSPFHYRWFRQVAACPASAPRKAGIPRKRPLF